MRDDEKHVLTSPSGTLWSRLCGGFLMVFLLASLSPGQVRGREGILKARGVLSLDRVPVGSEFQVAVIVEIDPKWHINAHTPLEDMYVPTELILEPLEGVSFGEVVYPRPLRKSLSFSPEEMALYEGEVILGLSAELAEDLPPGVKTIRAILSYQACDDETCLIPTEVEIDIPLQVVDHDQAINRIHPEIFTALGFDGSSPVGGGKLEAPIGGGIGRLLQERGFVTTFLFVFLGGLALNLTPCVYPLIPITIGYFGGQSGGSTRKTFLLALIYVLGMAVTYSTLGVIAATTGTLLGATLQNPLALIFVALVLVLLSLSMFGLYAIRLPYFLTRLSGGGKEGGVGAFFMGLTVGLVAAPCVGPFVLGLLTFVGERASPLFGFFLFFTLAIGLGLPFLVLGTLSGSIRKLPRSGAWLVWVERVFGFILLAMAVYFLRPLLPDRTYWVTLSVLTLCAGLYLGWLEHYERRKDARRAPVPARGFQVIRKGAGAVGLVAAVWLLLAPGHVFLYATAGVGINWRPYDEELLQLAEKEGKPVIMDFFADWCLPCKELDKLAFSSEKVVKQADDFLTLKVDLTRADSPQVKSLRDRYAIRGVPTVVFLNSRGDEIKKLRFVGFLEAEDFLERMERALAHK